MDNFLHIFDFDYTLYKTKELISIWSPRGDYTINGRKCFRLNSRDYHHYKLAQDEKIDSTSFDSFHSIDWNKAVEIYPTCNMFKLLTNKMILTARRQSVDKYIRQKLPGDYIIKGLDDGDAAQKIQYIKSLKQKEVILYDDSYNVISLCRQNNIPCAYIQTTQDKTTIEYTI